MTSVQSVATFHYDEANFWIVFELIIGEVVSDVQVTFFDEDHSHFWICWPTGNNGLFIFVDLKRDAQIRNRLIVDQMMLVRYVQVRFVEVKSRLQKAKSYKS